MKRHFLNILKMAGTFIGIFLGVFTFCAGFIWMVNEWHVPVLVWSLVLLVVLGFAFAWMEEFRQ